MTRRLIYPLVNRIDYCSELFRIRCECCIPNRPVKFCIVSATVEWESVAVNLFHVKTQFGLADTLREQVIVKDDIPDQIIFLAPCTGAIECEFVVVTFTSHSDPLSCHCLRCSTVFLRNIFLLKLMC